MTLRVKVKSSKKQMIIDAEDGKNLLELLQENGFDINSACGGKGLCNKCLVYDNTADAWIRSCTTYVTDDMDIEVEEYAGQGVTDSISSVFSIDGNAGYGVALDLGTTTLAFYLYDLKTGEKIVDYSCLNPQIRYGADVINRIQYANQGKMGKLHQCLLDNVNEVLTRLMETYDIHAFESLYIAGNTTMMHFINNTHPGSLGEAPYDPVFLDMVEKTGKDLHMNVGKVTLLPSISAFLGSDLTMGMLSSGMLDHEHSLLIDLGTNGEIILKRGMDLYACSTATGPAFEGANIECGSGGVPGAISQVRWENGTLHFKTVHDAKPKTMAGSGLLDVVTILRELGMIDETGLIQHDVLMDRNRLPKIKDDRIYLTDDIYVSQKDIRQIQLAKSAIRAGVEAMITRSGLDYDDIEAVYVAGGFGFYLNVRSAIRLGLFPNAFESKINTIGNASAAGIKMCLLNKRKKSYSSELSRYVQTIDLTTNRDFNDYFMTYISF